MTLVRLRADPRRVRVSVRRHGCGWVVVIASREDGAAAFAGSPDPRVAVELALIEARGIGGVDPGCDWAYDHPQR